VQYTDLHLFTGDTSKSKEELLNKFASNINYVFFLPDDISATFIVHAPFSEQFVKQKVKFVIRNTKARRYHLFIKLFYAVKKSGAQVVLMHSMIKPWRIILAGIIFGKNTRILVQNHAERPYSGIRRSLQVMAAKFVSGFLFTSVEQGRPWLDAGIIKNTELIHGVMEGSTVFKLKDKEKAKEKLNQKDKTLFIWVGRLNENKDPMAILRAFGKYAKENQNARLWMIYGSYELLDNIREYIESNQLQSFIELKGKVEHHQLEELYNAADYFLLGSHYESGGYALCEAMACGCVPIVTAIPSFKMMLNDGACGYMFNPADDQALLEILRQLSPADLEKYKIKVLEKFNKDLSFEAIARRIADIASCVTSSVVER